MSDNKVKNTIILYNSYFYNEVDLDSFNKDELIISNTNLCDIKVNILTNDFKIKLLKVDNYWVILESYNVLFVINNRRIVKKKLMHGDQIAILDNSRNEIFNINFFLDFASGKEDYSKEIILEGKSEIKIGSALDNDIIIKDDMVNNYHCVMRTENKNRIIQDLDSKYCVYVNGNKVINSASLKDNDFIILCGYKLLYKEEKIYCSRDNIEVSPKLKIVINEKFAVDYPVFIRTPRMIWRLPDNKISIVAPPRLEKKQGLETFLNLIPTIGMSLLVLFLPYGNPIYRIGMLGVTVFSTVTMFIYNNRKTNKNIKKRNKMYIDYISKTEDNIKELIDKQRYVLDKLYPSVDEACSVIEKFERKLWEKSFHDEDFLRVYLGQGDLDTSIEIKVPDEEFGDREDDLLLKPREIKEKYSRITDVPIAIDLFNNYSIGVTGEKKNIYSLIRNIVLEISVFHYYEDVKFICLFDESDKDMWLWMRWLPHTWSNDRKVRFMAMGKESSHAILEVVNSIISKRQDNEGEFHPHYIMIVTSPKLLENESISKYIDRETSMNLGLTTLFAYEKLDLLPKQCSEIIEVIDSEKGKLINVNDSGNSIDFSFKNYDIDYLDQLSRRMGPIYVKKNYSENTLPSKITLYDLYHVNNVREFNIEARWQNNDVTKNILAPLGVNSSGNLISLNLHEKVHGPHGLVAGTTGSGKSELLQTIIISLAINYPPEDISFILIDYKGGGMANLFLKLPHLIGTITNLDGNLVNRSLTLIKSELKRRQELFAEYEVNHIDSYKKLEKLDVSMEKLPHLIIIADEFAELKSDQPDFMKELVSTARIGRSLGVHLILATQKPAGVVDSQIWSNSKFKLCLKVQDVGDSKEMLKKPDAAMIVEPGRGYLQVGNDEYYELIQTAYSGEYKYVDDSVSSEDIQVSYVSIEGIRKVLYSSAEENKDKEKITELDEIVGYIHDFSEYKVYKRCDKCWVEPLEEEIRLEELIHSEEYFYKNVHKKSRVEAIIGEVDCPNLLKRELYKINFAQDGNTLLIGGNGYGKTVFIQTIILSLIARYTPREVNIYVLDFASRILKVLEESNHVGNVVYVEDNEKVLNLFKMVGQAVQERKKIFSEFGASTLENYIEASGNIIPQILICIDNYSEFKENYPELLDEFMVFMREGPSYGINFVMTNISSNNINYKILNVFKRKICLTCNDKAEYTNLLGYSKQQPANIKGRAIIKLDNCYEMQIAKFGESNKEFERINEIREFINDINKYCADEKAAEIIVVPEKLTLESVIQNVNLDKNETTIPIGFNINDLNYIDIDIADTTNFTIVGKERSGKTNFIKMIIEVLKQKDNYFYIFDSNKGSLKEYSEYEKVLGYGKDTGEELRILDDILVEGERRKEIIEKQGEESLEKMPFVIVIIDDINNLIKNIEKKYLDMFEQVVLSYKNYKIITVAAGTEGEFKANTYTVKFIKALKESQTGIVFGALTSQTFFNNVKLKYGTKEREFREGEGYLILNSNFKVVKTPLLS